MHINFRKVIQKGGFLGYTVGSLRKEKHLNPKQKFLKKCKFNHYANNAVEQKHQMFNGNKSDIDSILKKIKEFSKFYISKDYENLAKCYTIDGKIFPDGANIFEGQNAIKERWILSRDRSVTNHIVTPVEIHIPGEA